MGVATPEFSTLAVSRAFAMPAGRAFKPPGPASFEINARISSVFVCAPLAPLPPPARSIAGAFLVPRVRVIGSGPTYALQPALRKSGARYPGQRPGTPDLPYMGITEKVGLFPGSNNK